MMMRDELTEMAVALGEAQQAQTAAEIRTVTAEQTIALLTEKVNELETTIHNLEANISNLSATLEDNLPKHKLTIAADHG